MPRRGRRRTHTHVLTFCVACVKTVSVPTPMTDDDVELRRKNILKAARWCFLNLGFAKTGMAEIAGRAHISRTLIYRAFRDKEDVYVAVVKDWLLSRHPAAREAARGAGSAYRRLLNVCGLLVFEPWAEMIGAPKAHEFFEVCERIDPESAKLRRKILRDCVATILRDPAAAEVFVLALDGLLIDPPSVEVLEQRAQVLAARFAK